MGLTLADVSRKKLPRRPKRARGIGETVEGNNRDTALAAALFPPPTWEMAEDSMGFEALLSWSYTGGDRRS